MNINKQIQDIIREKISDAQVTVKNRGGGHFGLIVTTQEFAGKNTLAKHKMVLGAIAPLMLGASAPVHAIDSLETFIPTPS